MIGILTKELSKINLSIFLDGQETKIREHFNESLMNLFIADFRGFWFAEYYLSIFRIKCNNTALSWMGFDYDQ